MSVNCYTNVPTFKARFFPSDDQSDTADDTTIDAMIQAASRSMDLTCHRRFWVTASDEIRYYTAEFPDMLRIDDMPAAPTEIAIDIGGNRTYPTVFAASDYDMEPYNAQLESPPRPYTKIMIAPFGRYGFPAGHRSGNPQKMGMRKGVRITGKFGFCTLANCPDGIREATLLQAVRWFKRKDAVFGLMGSSDMGTVVIPSTSAFKLDPDIVLMIKDYIKFPGLRGV